jgi:pyridoxamine 5'-phosphate oxidase
MSATAASADAAIAAALREEVIPHDDPLALFGLWFDEARGAEPNDANAMALATAAADGRPSVRMVLLKDWGEHGFTFYTNAQSRKGEEIAANPHAALLFHWKSLRRQVRIEGPLSPVGVAETDAYFHSRARESQLGAVASDQSRPLAERGAFVERYLAAEQRFAGREVERPAYWHGFRLEPQSIEFWHDRPFRLHERRLFSKAPAAAAAGWTSTLLYP